MNEATVPTATPAPREWRWALFTVLIVCAALLPFLLVATPAWDGWPHYTLFMRGDAQAVRDHLLANGRPLGGWAIVQPMAWFGALHGPKLLMAACVLVSAAGMHLALRIARVATPAEAALVGVLTVCGPALQMVMVAAMPQYFVGMAALFAGLACFAASDRWRGWARAACYAAAIVLGGVAVLFGEAPLALLPLYPLLLVAGRTGTLGLLAVLPRWRELLRHGAPVLAGAAALALQFRLYPAYGVHEGAHDLNLEPHTLAPLAADYAAALGERLAPVGAALLVLLAAGFLQARRRPHWRALDLVALGVVVLLLGLLPYFASGRAAQPYSWDVRALLLAGAGTGLVALGLVRLVPAPDTLLRPWLVAVAVAAALGAASMAVPLAVRQVTDDALLATVAREPAFGQPAIVVVHDPGMRVADPYLHYEWTAMVQLAAQRNDLIALPPHELPRLAERIAYLQRDLRMLGGDPTVSGCQIDVELPLRRAPFFVLRAWQGVWLRWTHPLAYQQWLRGAVRIKVRSNCSTALA